MKKTKSHREKLYQAKYLREKLFKWASEEYAQSRSYRNTIPYLDSELECQQYYEKYKKHYKIAKKYTNWAIKVAEALKQLQSNHLKGES